MKPLTAKQALLPGFTLPLPVPRRRHRAVINSIEKASLRLLKAGLLAILLISLYFLFTVQLEKQKITHSDVSAQFNVKGKFQPSGVNKSLQPYTTNGSKAIGDNRSKGEIVQRKAFNDTLPASVSEHFDIWLVARPLPDKQIFVTLTALLASTLDRPFINVQTIPRNNTVSASYFKSLAHLEQQAKFREARPPSNHVSDTVYDRMIVGAALAGSQVNEKLEEGSRRGLLLLHDDMMMRSHGLEKLLDHVTRIEQANLREYVLDCGSMAAQRTGTALTAIVRLTADYGPNSCLYIPARLVPSLSRRFESLSTTDPTPTSWVIAGWLAEQSTPWPWLSLVTPIGAQYQPVTFR